MDNHILEKVKLALDKAIQEKKMTQDFMRNIGPAVIDAIKPVLNEIAKNSQSAKLTKAELLQAISQIKIDVPKEVIAKIPTPQVNIPPIKMPDFPEFPKFPEIRVPKPEVTVNFDASRIKVPAVKMPEEMDIRGWVNLQGYDRGFLQNPFPVQLRDKDGNPVNLLENLTTLISGGGGGGARIVKVSSLGTSAFAEITNPDGRLKVELPTGSSGLTDTELRASSVPVSQVSGANWSVLVTEIFGSTSTDLINPDGRMKVELPTGSSGLTDTELRASSIPVSQASGANWSVEVTSFSGSVEAYLIDGDGNYRDTLPVSASSLPLPSGAATSANQQTDALTDSELRASGIGVHQVSSFSWSVEVKDTVGLTNTEMRASSLPVSQASGANWSVEVSNFSDSVEAYLVDGDGNYRDTLPVSVASLPLPSGAATSANQQTDALTDTEIRASGIGVHQVSGFSWSVEVKDTVGLTDTELRASGVPVSQASGANWSVEVSNFAASVGASLVDSSGVQYSGSNPLPTKDVYVRGNRSTAYATISSDAETTLIAGTSATFKDLVYIMGANQSDGAVTLDIVSGTGGSTLLTLEIPANSTAGISSHEPVPMTEAGQPWRMKFADSDVTGTTVDVTGLFKQE